MYKRIIVPIDGSNTSVKALAAGLQLAKDSGGRVRLFHAIDEMAAMSGHEYSRPVIKIARENAARVLDEGVAQAVAAGVQAEIELVDTPGVRLSDSVVADARQWEADLIVVGTHGRRGVSRLLLGSGAEQIIRMAPVPVLVIRGEEASSTG